MTTDVVGDIAAREGVTLHELSSPGASLEDIFFELTAEAVRPKPAVRELGSVA